MTEPTPTETPRPWLIAAWPGMGNVAIIAAGMLIQQLAMKPVGQLGSRLHFDVGHVEVTKGLISAPRLPRGVLYRTPQNRAGRPLYVFVGEAQPAVSGFAYAQKLLDRAVDLGVERVLTFASLASGVHPSDDSSVYAAATSSELLDECRRHEILPAADGQIGGLNGVLLGAAASRGLAGICLMGEIPFFAANMPNPKAARAALDTFAGLADLTLDLSELDGPIAAVEEAMVRHMERVEGGRTDKDVGEEGPDASSGSEAKPEASSRPRLDAETARRIDEMFDQARSDRSRAVELKVELDRLGVFDAYEDQFLDLFRRAG